VNILERWNAGLARWSAGLVVATLAMATLGGWLAGGGLMWQVQRIDGRVQLLQQRLAPVAPINVLCGISAQVQTLHQQLADHCGTVHGATVPVIPLPAICAPPAAHDPARYSPAYQERDE
jgi:hypothetical protein